MILFGVFLIGLVLFLISAFETGSRSRVYAVDANGGRSGYQSEFQAGLMGVVNGVAVMQDYSDAVRLSSVAGSDDEILAGAMAVNKLAIHQNTIASGTRKASELGYYAVQAVQSSQMSQDEYYTLLRIVEAEATGGDVMSKMMVAGVVLNRVRDSHFPDTISEVVWQNVDGSPQFQPTQDGRFYTCEITDSTIEAVDRVLAGEDYSQGALFFFARTSSASSAANWFDSSLVRLFEYGGHEYFTFQS
jgi:N-acetylmuramoyl-L-alanine amidase